MNLRLWLCAAVRVMALGTVVLWGTACRGEIPLVQVQGIDPTMDRDYVRVQGVVARYPDYDPITELLTFWLDDGTGAALVILHPDESRALLDRGQVPTIGDQVSVAGTLRAGKTKALGDFVALTVSEPAQLEVEAPVPIESSIIEASAWNPYQKVLVQGQVSEVWQPTESLTVLRIQDGATEIDVVYDQSLEWISGAPTTVLPGDAVRVRGAVMIHKGQAQIVLDAASGLQRLPAVAVQPTVQQATLTPRRPAVTVIARSVSATPTAVMIVLEPASTTALPTTVPPVATLVPVERGDPGRGSVSEDTSTDVGVVHPVQTGLLSAASLGSSVMVEGRIERATLLSAGCKSIVDDGSGPAVVWMPEALYEQLVDPTGWNVGAVVRVTGRVTEYKGELEVVPQAPEAILPVQRAFPAAGPDAVIGSLSVADLDRRVTVAGEMIAVEPFSAGVKCVLDDGSGKVILLLWQNVFEALADKEALAVGVRVRVSGWVQEYRGDLEIVPGLPHDVAILESAGGR